MNSSEIDRCPLIEHCSVLKRANTGVDETLASLGITNKGSLVNALVFRDLRFGDEDLIELIITMHKLECDILRDVIALANYNKVNLSSLNADIKKEALALQCEYANLGQIAAQFDLVFLFEIWRNLDDNRYDGDGIQEEDFLCFRVAAENRSRRVINAIVNNF